MSLRKGWKSWAIYVDFILVPFIIFLTNYIPDFASGSIIALDEGQHLGAINELLRGAVPYREVHMVTGPLMQYIPCWLMQIFGVQLSVHRGFYLFGYVLSLVSAFVLLRTLVSNPILKYSALFFILRFPMDCFWNIIGGGIRWAPGFMTLLFLYLWLRDKKRVHLFLAGVICGLGLLFSQDMGIIPGAFAVLCILLKSTENRTIGHFLRNLMRNGLRFFFGFALAVLPFYCFLIIHNAFVEYLRMQFIDTLFLFPWKIPYSFPLMSIADILNPVTENSFMKIRSAAFYAMSFACVPIFIWTLVNYGRRPRYRMTFLLSLTAYTAIMLKSGARPLQGPQFAAILPIFFITVATFLETWLDIGSRSGESDTACPPERHGGSRIRWKNQLLFVAIAVTIALTGNPWTFFKDRISTLWDRESLRTHEYLDPAIMARAKGVRVPVYQAVSFNGVVGFLGAHTNEQDSVFAFPSEAHINFLAERRSPTRFHTALYSGVRDEYMEEIVRDLETKKPKYIVYNPDEYRILDVPNEERLRPIWKYIETHYQALTSFGTFRILVRAPDDGAPASNGSYQAAIP